MSGLLNPLISVLLYANLRLIKSMQSFSALLKVSGDISCFSSSSI